MRKSFLYIIMIACAYSLVACVKSETDNTDRLISFAPVAGKPTKAIIEGTTYPTSESFVVSAYHNGTAAYFEDQTASYNSSNALWETAIPEYWPLAGSLNFIAYSPASVNADITSSGVTVDDYTITTAEQLATDLLYANYTVADCASHPEAAAITFSHALSQVVFRVKASDYYANTTFAMTSLSLEGINSVGDFSVDSWSNQASEHTYTITSSSTALTYDANDEPETITLGAYLFIPQALGANAALNVGYSITQTVNSTDYTVTNPPVSIHLGGNIVEWEPGKKYIYTLNIGLNNLIQFTATAQAWGEAEGGVVVE